MTTYLRTHQRIWKDYGKATEYECRNPECSNQANQWAYKGNSPDELTTERPWNGRTRTVRYSPNPDDYQPLCHSCHVKFDRPATQGKTCRVFGCQGKHKARGLCRRHYQNYRNWGWL